MFIPWRCLWCNGYRRLKWTWQAEFKPWTRLLEFHILLIFLQKVWIQLFSFQLWVNSRVDWALLFGMATGFGEGKLWIQANIVVDFGEEWVPWEGIFPRHDTWVNPPPRTRPNRVAGPGNEVKELVSQAKTKCSQRKSIDIYSHYNSFCWWDNLE